MLSANYECCGGPNSYDGRLWENDVLRNSGDCWCSSLLTVSSLPHLYLSSLYICEECADKAYTSAITGPHSNWTTAGQKMTAVSTSGCATYCNNATGRSSRPRSCVTNSAWTNHLSMHGTSQEVIVKHIKRVCFRMSILLRPSSRKCCHVPRTRIRLMVINVCASMDDGEVC
jgi:hypothetical protein